MDSITCFQYNETKFSEPVVINPDNRNFNFNESTIPAGVDKIVVFSAVANKDRFDATPFFAKRRRTAGGNRKSKSRRRCKKHKLTNRRQTKKKNSRRQRKAHYVMDKCHMSKV